MDFPVYVPAGARAHIRRTLEGDHNGLWQGVNAFVVEYRAKGSTRDVIQDLEREQACLLRFATDLRMRDVYAELSKVLTTDDEYATFLRCAWIADMDYARFRARTKRAKELAPQIAAAARALATLLHEAGRVGGGVAPDKFFSLPDLLDATDNHEQDDHNLHMWRTMRQYVTGNRPDPERVDATASGMPLPQTFVIADMEPGDATTQDPKEQSRNTLLSAWEKAPDLPALLETVARAADGWHPQEPGAVGAAISSRKSNPVTEYVRAFAKLLNKDLPGLELSAPILAAMTGTADVVLNKPNTATTVDAVRKALIRPVEDSG